MLAPPIAALVYPFALSKKTSPIWDISLSE